MSGRPKPTLPGERELQKDQRIDRERNQTIRDRYARHWCNETHWRCKMRRGTYLQRLSDGRYEYGVLKENSRCLGAYCGTVEWEILPPTQTAYGVVNTIELARGWMAILEQSE